MQLQLNIKYVWMAIALIAVAAISACSTAPKSKQGKADIEAEARSSLATARRQDPSLARLIDNSAGVAVFPSVGKGAAGVGGAYGKGVLFEGSRVTGYCDLSQATIGLQLGGQSYTQLLVFENQNSLSNFKGGNLRFAAQATAVAIKSGAGANAQFTDGVAVFTMDEAGLMFEASIGGQRFSFQPR